MISETMRKLIENASAAPVEPQIIFTEEEARGLRNNGEIRRRAPGEPEIFYGMQVMVLGDFNVKKGMQ